MENDSPNKLYTGAGWQTTRRSLAQLLFTLDSMQGFVQKLHGAINPLCVLGGLAQDALIEVDFLSADLAADDVPARLRWNVVEARQMIVCLRELADEAHEAMEFQRMTGVPVTVLAEFNVSLQRIKRLLVGAANDDAMAA